MQLLVKVKKKCIYLNLFICSQFVVGAHTHVLSFVSLAHQGHPDWNGTVQSFISMVDNSDLDDMEELFHLPLSSQAYAQFQHLLLILDNVHLEQGNDRWSYIGHQHVYFKQSLLKFDRYKAGPFSIQMVMKFLLSTKKKIFLLAAT